MAAGLGMTPEEWEGLRAQVDDSFWVLRVIGTEYYYATIIHLMTMYYRIPSASKRSRRVLMWCTQVVYLVSVKMLNFR